MLTFWEDEKPNKIPTNNHFVTDKIIAVIVITYEAFQLYFNIITIFRLNNSLN